MRDRKTTTTKMSELITFDTFFHENIFFQEKINERSISSPFSSFFQPSCFFFFNIVLGIALFLLLTSNKCIHLVRKNRKENEYWIQITFSTVFHTTHKHLAPEMSFNQIPKRKKWPSKDWLRYNLFSVNDTAQLVFDNDIIKVEYHHL